MDTTTATDRFVNTLMQDPAWMRQFLTGLSQRAAYLTAKRDWDREDNYEIAEWVMEELGEKVPDKDVIAIYTDGGYEVDPELIEERLEEYLPHDEDDEDEDEDA